MGMPYVVRSIDGTYLVLSDLAADAAHTHQSAAEGGTLTAAALQSRTRNFLVPLSWKNSGGAAGDYSINDTLAGIPVFPLNDSGTNFVTGVAPIPEDYDGLNHVTVRFRWRMASATSGNVRIRGNVGFVRVNSGASGDALAAPALATVAVNASSAVFVEFTMTTTILPTPGDWLKVSFVREGGDGDDTAAGDLYVVDVAEVEYTADM
jgi:hypothetical protein